MPFGIAFLMFLIVGAVINRPQQDPLRIRRNPMWKQTQRCRAIDNRPYGF